MQCNFESVNFGYCGKHFALDLEIFLGFKAKCLDFPQCPQIIDAQLYNNFISYQHALSNWNLEPLSASSH